MRSMNRFMSDNTPRRRRYTLNWRERVCGCWVIHWLSYEADVEHIDSCQTYRYGVDWYDRVNWWVRIWSSSSH